MCRALKLLLNARSHFTFTFEISDHKDSILRSSGTIYFTRLGVGQWCSVSANHPPLY